MICYCFIDNASLTAHCEIDIMAVVEAFAGLLVVSIWVLPSILEICALNKSRCFIRVVRVDSLCESSHAKSSICNKVFHCKFLFAFSL